MSDRGKSFAFLTAAAFCWGLGTVLSKHALGGVPPLTLLPMQLLISCMVLGLVLVATRTRLGLSSAGRRAALLGILNPGLAYALGLIALSRIDASISVVLWATEPVLVVLLAVAFLHERLRADLVVSLVVAMGGVALIVGRPSGVVSISGVVLTLAAVMGCAIYAVVLRALRADDSSTEIVFAQQVVALGFALVVLMVVVAVEGMPSLSPSGSQLAAAALSGGIYYGIAFSFFVAGLRRTTAARAGIFLVLVPVFGLILSAVLLGETLTPEQVVGAVLVVAAVSGLAYAELRRGKPEQVREMAVMTTRNRTFPSD